MNSSRVRVKMCGMTRRDDLAHAVSLGVDAVGFIFYSKSTRYITLEKARALLKEVPPFVDVVAVLVNPEQDLVHQLIKELPIQLLQFHGDESAEFCEQFNTPYIKAIHPLTREHIEQASQQFIKAKAILLDTPSEYSRGGTGLSFDWHLIPAHLSQPYIVAGGLNEFNVTEAVKACDPYAVDVCSGIEALPGIKDHLKMSRFIKALWG